eukprot:1524545-Pleurochrysis_carterae.AAC.1
MHVLGRCERSGFAGVILEKNPMQDAMKSKLAAGDLRDDVGTLEDRQGRVIGNSSRPLDVLVLAK